ncbi:fungal-specific transcription factor domain-containing protein [Exophiala viscosa]|uniref:fungal-specific transcription factor domain-containing protein n=1 Tax=Exophiala viscosa TaxID=2486360 RepID=UPI00219C1FF7|nr:fungal-specific transcription factor domain-containing protein [Exophiala viscosa]
MEVQIPSPSVFLKKSPILTPAPAVPPKRSALAKAKASAPVKAPNKPATTVQDGAVTKPKQSKSRNGCMTCKKKRLKCDETKPSCAQCQKRSVVCEGYKKDYKWRTFEETTFNPKPAAKKKAFRSNSFNTNHNGARPLDIASGGLQGPTYRGFENANPPQTWSPGLHTAFTTAAHAFQRSSQSQRLPSSVRQEENVRLHQGPSSGPEPATGSIPVSTFDGGDLSPDLAFDEHADPYSLLTTGANSPTGDGKSVRSFSSGSPRLLDLLLPGTDLNQPPDPSEVRPPVSPVPYQPSGFDPSMILAEDFDEEIIRSDAMATTTGMPSIAQSTSGGIGSAPTWRAFRASSPTPSETSTTSSKSSGMTILAQPSMDASSPEMLMLRFDKSTCGILSVKDGPTENPWRTLIWPLARESPALYHAISSMTAFHGAHEVPMLHMPGMAHMTKSIKKLAFEIENMRLDSALATSLALAFSEGWDSHVSTGVQHLRGAKIMVNNAMAKHRRDMQLGQMTTQDASRLKFLCNTFVYMDVIARLTSLEEANELNFEEILATVNAPFGDQMEVDPLMGCATTLFPLIGRVANLIQRVRKTESNSLTLISSAMELKELLQQWQVPSALLFERPEDPNSEVQHSIQTAEAYRYATLLYLHQAVPEIPSDSAQSLAKKVLVTLASVPLSSRTTIVQIFPLFAASCEVTDSEDRNWVQQRWVAMMARLKIGNVTSCWSVVQEVWARRDEYENEKADRLLRRFSSRGVPSGNFVPPNLNMPPGLKRKAHTFDVANQDGFFNDADDDFPQTGSATQVAGAFEGLDRAGRPLKRRVTMDPMSEGLDMSMPLSVSGPAATGFGLLTSTRNRRSTANIASSDQLEEEYTVRGRLHWLGVMADWQWEVFLG